MENAWSCYRRDGSPCVFSPRALPPSTFSMGLIVVHCSSYMTIQQPQPLSLTFSSTSGASILWTCARFTWAWLVEMLPIRGLCTTAGLVTRGIVL